MSSWVINENHDIMFPWSFILSITIIKYTTNIFTQIVVYFPYMHPPSLYGTQFW
jgi:hypothetical protein